MRRDEMIKTWDAIRAPGRCEGAPTWLVSVFDSPLDQVWSTGRHEEAPDDADIRVYFEQRTLDESYLQWLNQQIELNARDTHWLNTLRTRIQKLKPLVGRKLVSVKIRMVDHSAWIESDVEQGVVVLVEVG